MIKAAKETLKMTEKTSDKIDDCVLLSIELNGVGGKENKLICKYNIKGKETIVTLIRSKVLEDLEGCNEASWDLFNKFLEIHKIKDIYDIEWITNIDAKKPTYTKKITKKKPLKRPMKQKTAFYVDFARKRRSKRHLTQTMMIRSRGGHDQHREIDTRSKMP
eukprot:10252988-Ditylum_brightwellii.AAC.1